MKAKVTVIRFDGTEEEHVLSKGTRLIADIEKLIFCDCMDTVNLRDGRVMLVDDNGIKKNRSVNTKATELYRSICRPGTKHQIRGDVAIALDEDFA
jgi:Ni,Fe-hydrogenase maturation factor